MLDFSNADDTDALSRVLADAPALRHFYEAHLGGREQADARRSLLELADSSAFSTRQWIESLSILHTWLSTRALTLPIEDAIGYVSCAAESAGPAANLSDLPSLVTEMLEAYGCERAEPRDTAGDAP
jgi:hypothetical protein